MKTWGTHIALLALVLFAGLLATDYHQGNLARIMVLAVYATGWEGTVVISASAAGEFFIETEF